MASSPDDTAFFLPLMIAVATTLGTIVIHALAVAAVVEFIRYERKLHRAGVRFWRDVAIVGGVTLLALAAHLIEITAWAVVFVLCGEFSGLAEAFYNSAVNYTSLGLGDVVMSGSWKLLAPLETAAGMLMFGVSTAMIFAVCQRLVQTRLRN
ncbi:MAG: ion channel [Rhodoplanes sp.]